MTSKHSQAQVLISQGIFDSIKTFRDFEQRVSALFDTNTKAQGDAFEIRKSPNKQFTYSQSPNSKAMTVVVQLN